MTKAFSLSYSPYAVRLLCRAMSCFSADKQIYLVDHSRVQDMDKTRPTAVLASVTGLTGLCQRTASSQEKKEKKLSTRCFLSACG